MSFSESQIPRKTLIAFPIQEEVMVYNGNMPSFVYFLDTKNKININVKNIFTLNIYLFQYIYFSPFLVLVKVFCMEKSESPTCLLRIF
jgi:hypothetical protein